MLVRKSICAALLVLLLMPSVAVAQTASTEGTEFWVTLTVGDNDEKKKEFAPYLAVSAKEPCVVTVTNPLTNYSRTINITTPNSWTEFTPDLVQWYPSNSTDNGQDYTYSEVVKQTGLLVTSTKTISLYAAHRMKYSFDASNVLPVTALGDEYIVQDYPPSEQRAVFAIVATENNTVVDITPSAKTVRNQAGATFSVTLQRGETYQVMSDAEGSQKDQSVTLSGSYVKTRDGKKIALFNGCVRTRIPNPVSARDLLYEQAMPTAYWGTQFVVTGSKTRAADRVRVTALNDGTTVKVNGQLMATLNSRETYEFELVQNASQIQANQAKKETNQPTKVNGDACLVETSCPCAVNLYMLSVQYDHSSGDDPIGGDPSMVWVSPIEQRIRQITFGVCETTNTHSHYVNVVTETSNVSSMRLLDSNGTNKISAADFTPLTAAPGYSYARVLVQGKADGSASEGSGRTGGGQAAGSSEAFTLSGDGGFIAHVYGNGYKESYAYSVGSATVARSIVLNGSPLSNGSVSPVTFCLGTPIHVETNFGVNTVDSVSWDMGDGVLIGRGDSSFFYTYDAAGWFDMVATTKTTNPCTGYVYRDTIVVSFRVDTARTIRHFTTECSDTVNNLVPQRELLEVTDYGCDSVVYNYVMRGYRAEGHDTITAENSYTLFGRTYTESTVVDGHTSRSVSGCDSVVHYHLRIVDCLSISISQVDDPICPEEQTSFSIGYNLHKGGFTEATIVFDAAAHAAGFRDGELNHSGNRFVVPLPDRVVPGRYSALISLVDELGCEDKQLPVSFTINYPSNIFAQKWTDVLAVFNPGFGANYGYEFTAYQWYANGQPIKGATGPNLYIADQLDSVPYSVELTRLSDGLTLMSCPMIPQGVSSKSAAKASVKPNYVLRSERVQVNSTMPGTATVYTTVGLPVASYDISEGQTTLPAPAERGAYLIRLHFDDGTEESARLLVR